MPPPPEFRGMIERAMVASGLGLGAGLGGGDALMMIDRSMAGGFGPGELGTRGDDAAAGGVGVGGGVIDPVEMLGDVAVLHVRGVLLNEGAWWSGVASLPELEAAADRLAVDERVSGVVLMVDSPGGTVAGTAEVADAVGRLRAVKPVAAVARSLMASAAMWIGSQAGRVFVGRTAKVGSIGTFAMVPDVSKMYEGLGVRMHVVGKGEFKGAGQPGTVVTEAQLADFGRIVEALNEHFLEGLAGSGLGMSMEAARGLNTGQLWVGRDAVGMGLAHAVGGLDEALEWIRGGVVAGGVGSGMVRAAGEPGRDFAADCRGSIGMKINSKQRNFLVGLGMVVGASAAVVEAFVAGLKREERAKFEGMAEKAGAGTRSDDAAGRGVKAEGGDDGDGEGEGDDDEEEEEDEGESARTAPQPPERGSGGLSGGGGMTAAQVAAASEAAVARALQADRTRASNVRGIGRSVHMSEALIEQHVAAGTSVEGFREVALANASAQLGPISGLGGGAPGSAPGSGGGGGGGGGGYSGAGGGVSMGADLNRDSLELAIEDAVFARIGMSPIRTDDQGYVVVGSNGLVETRAGSERSRQFGGRSLGEMGRAMLTALGASPLASQSMPQVAQSLFDRRQLVNVMGAAGSHSTSDFPGILANVANKVLRKAYVEARVLWPLFCRRETAPDFKTISRVQLGEMPVLPEVQELERIKEVTVGEATEQYFLRVFAYIFGLSWQTVVNDDLNALSRIPRQMGAAASRSRDILAFSVLTGNPIMADGQPLFSVAHGNLATGGDVGLPSTEGLNAMASSMGVQSGLGSNADQTVILDLEAKGIIVPRAIEGTTKELLGSQSKPGGTNDTVNIWRGELDMITSGRLDADSTTAWYGFADNAEIDTIEMGFLEGMAQPMVTQEEGFDVLGRRYRVVDVAEAKAIDWRGLYKNPGS